MADDSKARKPYDLERRTFPFAQAVRDLVGKLRVPFVQQSDVKQLVRSSGSVAANFIEANEALSRRDFHHRVRICRKETKESQLWLRLVEPYVPNSCQSLYTDLLQEVDELMRIFGTILKQAPEIRQPSTKSEFSSLEIRN